MSDFKEALEEQSNFWRKYCDEQSESWKKFCTKESEKWKDHCDELTTTYRERIKNWQLLAWGSSALNSVLLMILLCR